MPRRNWLGRLHSIAVKKIMVINKSKLIVNRLNGSGSSFRDRVGNNKKQSAKEFAASLEAKTPCKHTLNKML